MKIKIIFFIIILSTQIIGQVVTSEPKYPTQNDAVIIYFDATKGTAGLKDYTGDVYAHTGLLTTKSSSPTDWKYVKTNWGQNTPETKLERVEGEANLYKLVIGPSILKYYLGNGSLQANEKILQLAFVFRSATQVGGSYKEGKDTGGKDIFLQIFEAGISVVVNSPTLVGNYGDPLRSPVFARPNDTINISASTAEVGTITSYIKIFINNSEKASAGANTISYNFVSSEYNSFRNEIKILAADTAGKKDSALFVIVKNPAPNNIAPPAGIKPGINYSQDNSTVTLALFAPYKEFVYVIGDFNDWKVDENFFMNRYEAAPDSVIFWLAVNNLTTNEYSYQYFVNGTIRLADPYAEKILDPANDGFISSTLYPNLKAYPGGKTGEIVSVLQTGQQQYNWQVENFQKPEKKDLVIYELLIRDFVSTHSYKTLIDTLSYLKKLGVNAIELMPIMEFEGNSSWGYNPSFHLAVDKYYGPKNELKRFIDQCHKNGIAVILDMVLNHAFGQSPLVRLYWDSALGRPAANSPWFNQVPKHDYNVGYDFNHESKHTKYFVDRVTEFWLKEYKFDGFRFDLSKGFTQKNTLGNVGAWGAKDDSRIAIWKRIADKIWQIDPTAYVILEHFADNSEEKILADYGMMLWGNMNYNYNEATMGWVNTSNFSNVSYKYRGWSNPHLIGYMESHDEERLMYKNLQYGNSSGSYNIKSLNTALRRIEAAAAFFFTVPGPKMIWQFGELGYDLSINWPSNTSSDRLTPKPPKWEYLQVAERKNLFNVFAALIRLKKAYPVFSTTNFNLSLSGAMKSIQLNDPDINVTIIGNFGVTANTINPNFQQAVRWYEFFTGDSIEVSVVSNPINLQPGEYRLYSTKKFPSFNIITGIGESTAGTLPLDYILEQNYPNPFNPATQINFAIPEAGFVSLKIYDLLGREVATLIDEFMLAGNYSASFESGKFNLASGVYYYRLRAGKFQSTKRMVLIK